MDINPFEFELFRDLAFLTESHAFNGMALRPLSLASRRAMELMEIKLLDEAVQLTLEEEQFQIRAYLWLHGADLQVVTDSLWTGRWRHATHAIPLPEEAFVIDFRLYMSRLSALVKACDFDIRPQPKPKNDDTPKDVIGGSMFAFRVGMICRVTNLPPKQVKWHLFLPEALQYCLRGCRREGMWTVPKGVTSKDEDFEDCEPEWMRAAQIDTPAAE